MKIIIIVIDITSVVLIYRIAYIIGTNRHTVIHHHCHHIVVIIVYIGRH